MQLGARMMKRKRKTRKKTMKMKATAMRAMVKKMSLTKEEEWAAAPTTTRTTMANLNKGTMREIMEEEIR